MIWNMLFEIDIIHENRTLFTKIILELQFSRSGILFSSLKDGKLILWKDIKSVPNVCPKFIALNWVNHLNNFKMCAKK